MAALEGVTEVASGDLELPAEGRVEPFLVGGERKTEGQGGVRLRVKHRKTDMMQGQEVKKKRVTGGRGSRTRSLLHTYIHTY